MQGGDGEEHHEDETQSESKKRKLEKAAAELKDGEVIVINSASELEIKLFAACKLRRLAIISFMATWCGPCRYMSPEYTSLAVKYPKVVFLKVDIDEATNVAMAYKVSSIPNFFFVKEGKQIDQLVTVDKNTLEEKIAQHSV
ncbi:hypothetical protein ACJIZ3_010021 [Penstemon smallii]|uniref:Thioredoxin domain-containing protein n=1 Tax=Penstemon smallii TaxID=265156 RepID=A0ABD3TFP8_9LAMI